MSVEPITEEQIAGLRLDESAIIARVAEELHVKAHQVSAVMALTRDGGTVPFISRYRKEMTGGLDEVQVRASVDRFASFSNLETRRLEIIRAIHGQGKLDSALYAHLLRCTSMVQLEDIYAPFKRKKKTRGMLARERGLEGLAELLQRASEAEVADAAPSYVRVDAEHPELSVASAEEAIQGAKDIVAEEVSHDPDHRSAVKALFLRQGRLVVRGVGDAEKKAKSTYQIYWDHSEPLSAVKPHRVLAINRGVREGELESKVEVDDAAACALLRERIGPANRWHGEAIDDGLARLLSPAVVRELQSEMAARADEHGIGVFSANLHNLLMTPPLKGTRVLGMDPGIRTGTKCAAIDETGKLLTHFVIYQERDPSGAAKAIAEAVKEHRVELIAVGNGTGSREVRKVVADAVAAHALAVKQAVVDEDGASVYSASEVAREEFPELDLTIRGAISIGRRLQDPLAELVKIDPKSIGVGLYQHDVDQKSLSAKLDEVVGSVVNNVGVNLNTASASLLRYVSGIGLSLARKIVRHRDAAGAILSREALMRVPGMGPKTFEQSAGFLKIPESPEPLDNSWVHPENYELAREVRTISTKGAPVAGAKRAELKERHHVGDATLDDILAELAKPNRDPRDEYPAPLLDQGLLGFEELAEGMKVHGRVKNVVDFGAFIDIGIKETALVHVSEMSNSFVKDPMSVLKVGDTREFRVISLDPVRRRIGLSLRSPEARPTAEPRAARPRLVSPRSASPRPAGPPPEVHDTTYNPFAEHFRKKGR
jgi:protein Tex